MKIPVFTDEFCTVFDRHSTNPLPTLPLPMPVLSRKASYTSRGKIRLSEVAFACTTRAGSVPTPTGYRWHRGETTFFRERTLLG